VEYLYQLYDVHVLIKNSLSTKKKSLDGSDRSSDRRWGPKPADKALQPQKWTRIKHNPVVKSSIMGGENFSRDLVFS
jgi:hypothetical protein